jgi:hypothetical protein
MTKPKAQVTSADAGPNNTKAAHGVIRAGIHCPLDEWKPTHAEDNVAPYLLQRDDHAYSEMTTRSWMLLAALSI